MSLSEKIKDLLKRLGSSKEENAMQMPADVQKLIEMVKNTREVEFSCEDVYNILDQYTELVNRGDDSAELMPLVEHHIEICPDCREEFEALLRILEATPA
jgi:translation initiation factor 2B subunit (eIF-2B alpha/beta/delta family)